MHSDTVAYLLAEVDRAASLAIVLTQGALRLKAAEGPAGRQAGRQVGRQAGRRDTHSRLSFLLLV